jgi:hypothetical protein
MNTSPIDTYDSAEAYFTFGPDSFGMWLFVILAMLAFLYVGLRAFQFEQRHFAEVTADADAQALAATATNGHEPEPHAT